SVHFLAGFNRMHRRGHSVTVSATHAAAQIGLPILMATVALVVGFSVLASSEFIPTATFGKLVAATLAVAALVNLTVLPALVVATHGGKK
ncbi:MAG: hypothetical protein AAGA03_09465, partial [Planctomycetota bacterium]